MSPQWLAAVQERDAVMRAMLHALEPLSERTLLEIGAAYGANVPYFLEWGFRRDALTLNEIRPQVAAQARGYFPGVRVVAGDAAELALEPHDVVVASTVFTSILNDTHRESVATTMWRLTKRGGGVLLYDFTWNNPNNPRVRKITPSEIRRLFPLARLHIQRVTLAPPLLRRVPLWLYHRLARIRALRTHVVCWLEKHQ